MTDISNTEYITINKDGVFVGGKPATKYRGKKIAWIFDVRKHFAAIQELNPSIVELHVLSSETLGKFAVAGNPSGNHGPNVWCRVKFNDGRIGSWVFGITYGSAADCAGDCAVHCVYNVRGYTAFRSAVFGIQNPELEKLKKVDLSKLVGQNQLNGYEIVVRKIAETKQIKR